MPQHVRVVAYDPRWATLYKEEAEKVREILDGNFYAIHHIGSTSVPGLMAKPIIDIMLVVKKIERVEDVYPQFERLGYECMGEFGIPGRRYFRKGGEERTHQVHLFEQSNQADIVRHLAVRDYLRTHGEVARRYGALKSVLAKEYPYDIDGYCDGKDAFVKQLERDALRWYSERGLKAK